VHGRVDPASLGTSLDQVGYCYSRVGRFEKALPWLERAVAAKDKGDVHGRVDPGEPRHKSSSSGLLLLACRKVRRGESVVRARCE